MPSNSNGLLRKNTYSMNSVIEQNWASRLKLVFIHKAEDRNIMFGPNRSRDNRVVVINNFFQWPNRHRSSCVHNQPTIDMHSIQKSVIYKITSAVVHQGWGLPLRSSTLDLSSSFFSSWGFNLSYFWENFF